MNCSGADYLTTTTTGYDGGVDTSDMDALLLNGDAHTHSMTMISSQYASPRRGNYGHRHLASGGGTHRSSARSLKAGSSTLAQLRPQISRFPAESDPTGRCIRLKEATNRQQSQLVPHLLNPLTNPPLATTTPPSTFGAELGVFNVDGTEAPETAMLPSAVENTGGMEGMTLGVEGGKDGGHDNDYLEHDLDSDHTHGNAPTTAAPTLMMGDSSSALGVRVSSSGGMKMKKGSIRLGNYASPVRASGDNTRMTRHAARLHAKTLVAGVTCTPDFAAHFFHGDEGGGGRGRPNTAPLVGGGSSIAGGRIPRGIGVQNSFSFGPYATAVDVSANPTATTASASSSSKYKKQRGSAATGAATTTSTVSSRVDDQSILRLQNKALERHLFDIRDMTMLIASRREELLQSDDDMDNDAIEAGGVRMGRRNQHHGQFQPEDGEINSIDASSTCLTEDDGLYGDGDGEYTDSEEWEEFSSSIALQQVGGESQQQFLLHVGGVSGTAPITNDASLLDVRESKASMANNDGGYEDDFEASKSASHYLNQPEGGSTPLLAASQQQTGLFNSRSITQQELSMFDPNPADIAASDALSRQQQRKKDAAMRRGSTSQHAAPGTSRFSQAGSNGIVGEDISEVVNIPNAVTHLHGTHNNNTTTPLINDEQEGSTSWRPCFLSEDTTTATADAAAAPHSPVSLSSRPSGGSLLRRSFQAATAAIALRIGFTRRSMRVRETPPKLPDAKGCGAVVDASSGSFSYFHYLDKLSHHHRRQAAKRRELQSLKDNGSPLTSEERKQLQLLTAIHEEEYHIRQAAAEHVAELSRKRKDEELARRAEEAFAFSQDCFGGDVAAAMAASTSNDTSHNHHHTSNPSHPSTGIDEGNVVDGDLLIVCVAPLGAIRAESTCGGNNSVHSELGSTTPSNNNRGGVGVGGGAMYTNQLSTRSTRKVSLQDDDDVNPFTVTRSHSISRQHPPFHTDDYEETDADDRDVQDRLVAQRMKRREVRKSILHAHNGADLFAGQQKGGDGQIPPSPSRPSVPNGRLSVTSVTPSLQHSTGVSPTASEGPIRRKRRAGENGSGSGVTLVPSPTSSASGLGFRTTTSVIIDAPDAPDANPYLLNTVNGGRSRTFSEADGDGEGGDIGDIDSQGSTLRRVHSGGSLGDCSGDIRNFTYPTTASGGGTNPAAVSSNSASEYNVQEGPSETALRLEADAILADCADLLEDRRQRSLAEFLTKKRRAAEIQLKAALDKKGISAGGDVALSSIRLARSHDANTSKMAAPSSKTLQSSPSPSHNTQYQHRTSSAAVSRSPHRGPSSRHDRAGYGGVSDVPPPLGTGTQVFVSERKGGLHGSMKQVSTGDISGKAKASLTASREALLRSPYPFTPSSLVRCDSASYEESTSSHRRQPSKYYGASPTTTRGYTSHHISKIARGLPTFQRSSAGGADSNSPSVNVSHEVQPSTNLLFLRQRLAKLEGRQ